MFYTISDRYIDYLSKGNHMLCPIKPNHGHITVNDEGDFKYKILMQSEYFFIKANRTRIEKAAVRLYKMRTKYNPELNGINKLMEITLDFSKLEKLCDEF